MQTTGYIIKPVAMKHRLAIREMIRRSGLTIVRSRRVKLTPKMVFAFYPRRLYGKFSGRYWGYWVRQITYGYAEIGIIRGYDAIRRFAALAGKETDPEKCGPETIRRRFGTRNALMIDGKAFHEKVVHRPLDAKEAAHDVPLLQKFVGI